MNMIIKCIHTWPTLYSGSAEIFSEIWIISFSWFNTRFMLDFAYTIKNENISCAWCLHQFLLASFTHSLTVVLKIQLFESLSNLMSLLLVLPNYRSNIWISSIKLKFFFYYWGKFVNHKGSTTTYGAQHLKTGYDDGFFIMIDMMLSMICGWWLLWGEMKFFNSNNWRSRIFSYGTNLMQYKK